MNRKKYTEELQGLQTGVCKLQEWWSNTKACASSSFSRAETPPVRAERSEPITERVSPRVFRVVALPAPSDREKTQMYFQRYMPHFPAAGEIVIFDRSYYNRAGVEHVVGFCTPEQHRNFLALAPFVERIMVDGGLILIKYWLEVGKDEQARRFAARVDDPLRQWKLSPMDIEAWQRWDDYTRAPDEMLLATDTPHAPWYIVRSDDKKKARLNCIAHLLSLVPTEDVPREKVKLPKRPAKDKYDPEVGLVGRKFVPELH